MVSSHLLWAACKEELYHACMRHTYTTRKRCVGHISMSACCVVEKHAYTRTVYIRKQSLPLSAALPHCTNYYMQIHLHVHRNLYVLYIYMHVTHAIKMVLHIWRYTPDHSALQTKLTIDIV